MTLPSHGFLPIRFIQEADFPEEIRGERVGAKIRIYHN